MSDFLLELLSEEIPARMQDKARADLARLFAAELADAGVAIGAIETFATPRRVALIARDLPVSTERWRVETKGPRASAPWQAIEGFLRKAQVTRDALVERDGVLFAVVEGPERALASLLAEVVAAIVRAFPWPKSMRWGAGNLRWVRPLQGIVALLGEEVVPLEIDGIASGAATVGHRFHHPGTITIGSAADYAAKLRACHVILDSAERAAIIEAGAREAAVARGLTVVPDPGLVAENAGLTEWPVPLLGDFDPAFLEVPREVIQLTMRTNQKYFACTDGEGRLAPNFICTANIEAHDGGLGIVAGNRKVLAARLADARFFWEQDLKVLLEEQAKKLSGIVFHEKLGTVADKVERVAKLARWLVEEGIVGAKPLPFRGRVGVGPVDQAPAPADLPHPPTPSPEGERERPRLANMAEQAARLCKADLVTGMVGEFPELQGVMGGYYARAEGLPDEVADAIRNHYKPVGQGDDVPTAPVTVAVSLADKLDTLVGFFLIDERPTGSKDPFALRRAAVGVISLLAGNRLRLSLQEAISASVFEIDRHTKIQSDGPEIGRAVQAIRDLAPEISPFEAFGIQVDLQQAVQSRESGYEAEQIVVEKFEKVNKPLLVFFADRLKVQQREAGVRHDLIDAVFALGGEDDLVRLLARVKALQSFVETEEGANLLAGYKRAANILRKEGYDAPATTVTPAQAGVQADGEGLDPGLRRDADEAQNSLSYPPEKEEAALLAALDAAEDRAEAAVAREDFEAAMAALSGLRAPIDAFFTAVTVNDADPAKRSARLAMLARIRAACHKVADFSKIEG